MKAINQTSSLMYFRIAMVTFAVLFFVISVLDAMFIKSAYGDNLIPVSILFSVLASMNFKPSKEASKNVVLDPKITKVLIPVLITSFIAGIVTFFFVL